MSSSRHIPVMLDEVLNGLDPQPGQTIIDGTLGGGGHTRALAERVGEDGLVIGFDRDAAAIARAETELQGLPVAVAHASYDELHDVLAELAMEQVDGLLLDLGLSSDQLADRERGFSFESAGPLDMRFDTTSGQPAWRWLEYTRETEIASAIYQYGEERMSRRIARAICARRKTDPIRTAADLAEIVRACVPKSRHAKIDPATRTFQALRIVVNDELQRLERVLSLAPQSIRRGGRAVVISFHSLEDRIVKNAFRDDPRWNVLTKRPLRPSDKEADWNPRARSAKLRVAEVCP